MKLIHCADIHLGSKIEAKLSTEKANIRKKEVRSAFVQMVEQAKENDVKAILISGDLFDSDRPLQKDKEFFYSVVKNTPEIDFLYLRGNHDSKESYTVYDLPNLKTFNNVWQKYCYENVCISAIEIQPDNEISMYSTLNLEESNVNIVMLHGYENINFNNLKNKNIDYLALGHLHTYKEEKLDDRGIYAYSGCLEGRGFDETGAKGYILLEIDEKGKIQINFIVNSIRIIEDKTIDISDCGASYEAYQKIKNEIDINRENLYRINLVGNIDFDNDNMKNDIEGYMANLCFFVSIKDKTRRILHLDDIKNEISIKGEFVRTVLASNEYDEETKQEIIETGLKALDLQEVEI